MLGHSCRMGVYGGTVARFRVCEILYREEEAHAWLDTVGC